MALTVPQTNNNLIKFREDVVFDFMRASRFDPYMGDGTTAPIIRVNELQASGLQVNIPLVNQLASNGVGAGVQAGAEEIIDDYGMPVFTDFARQAVAWNLQRKKDASFNIDSTSRSLLRSWAKRIVRDDLVDALLTIPTGIIQTGRGSGANGGNRVNGIRWANATAAERNAWSDRNSDRVLFGNSISNRVAGNVASSLANVDSVNDRLSAAIVSLAKRIAMATTTTGNAPAINPWMTEGTDEEWYVMFVGSRGMRDLRQDPTMFQANRDARAREADNATKSGGNPIFSGGALVWEGVIIKEIPEITTRLTTSTALATAGASSIPVEPFFLCGQAALAYASGIVPKIVGRDETDYEFLNGVGIMAQYGVAKVAKAPTQGPATALKDWGMVTGFVAGTPDT